MPPKISIVYPMYNEQENIHQAVERATDVLAPITDENYEIVIVNDASTDRTGEIADELAATDAHIRVVHHEVNRTLGGSIRTGLAHSKAELVLYMDADLPCDLDHLREAVPETAEADVVVGYRTNRYEGILRWLYTKVYNALVRWLFNIRVKDVNCPFKLFRRQVVEAMDLHSEGSFIDAEMLAEAQRAGFRIAQIPVVYTPRIAGQSTLARPQVIVKILCELWHYWWRRRGAKRRTNDD